MLLAPPAVTLRAATPGDAPLLRRLFTDSRAADFALLPGTDASVSAIIDLQFRAQSAMLSERFPDAEHEVICDGLVAVGRLVTSADSTGIRLAEITVGVEHQGRGIGSAALRIMLDRADALGLMVELSAWELNERAIRLYERLGFNADGSAGGYLSLRRTPTLNSGSLA